MRSLFFSSILLLFTIFSGFLLFEAEPGDDIKKDTHKKQVPFLTEKNKKWADSVLSTMTLDEKIGQLFMVAAYSNKDAAHQAELDSLISNYHIGGLIFFQGTPWKQFEMTQHFQKLSKLPLMIGIDGEWGLAMRLDSTMKFPKQMTLGAIKDDKLIYKMGKEIAEECKTMGIHVNFAPVADINNNPNNPVINYRSFGENKFKVTEKCLAYMNGMQDAGILANAKHFPGHGDTDTDSHKTLPIITHDLERLDTVEFYPFKHLIDSGLASTMVAHLYIPVLDSAPNRASTLSHKIVTDLLKIDLNFGGLIFTDALNMRGVSAYYNPGELEVLALQAGNDVLLFPENVPTALEAIKKAIESGKLKEKDIDEKCRKILMAKKWLKLEAKPKLSSTNLYSKLNSPEAKYLNQQLFENALTVIKNEDELLPIKNLDEHRIATVNIGAPAINTFSNRVDDYCSVDKYSISHNSSATAYMNQLDSLKKYDLVIVSIFDMNQKPGTNFGFSTTANDFINTLALDSNKRIVLNLMGNPYSLTARNCTELVDAILINYEERIETEDLSAQLLFGGIVSKGTLPVGIGTKWQEGDGLFTRGPIRMKYTLPLELGITDDELTPIDQIALQGIKDSVFPGCQIIGAKDGKIFYQKSFGNHTYDSTSKKVENTDIYDLASITKIASSTAAMMRLQSEGLVNVDSSLNTYLHDLVDSTQYKSILLKEMLTHQAGFTAWIPFYMRTLSKGVWKPEYYDSVPSEKYNLKVAENLYMIGSIRDSIFQRILTTDVSSKKKYLYSDIGYYFINEIIQRTTKTTQDQFVDSVFYASMGLDNIGYHPSQRWNLQRVPPTEADATFRKQTVQGYVHDQGAAMLGGVGGHAGLFSSANDLAVMMQMFMQYGTYGDQRYLDESVVKKYTSAPYYDSNRNRRGIGFDKAVMAGGNGPTCSLCASEKSFGHSGFTGTLTWADPDKGFVFVFLSNRTFPDAENRKIISTAIRTRIMQVFYDAINHAAKKS